jgi:hypothetical protein
MGVKFVSQLREEHGLSVWESELKIFGPKTDGGRRDERRIDNKELHHLCSASSKLPVNNI